MNISPPGFVGIDVSKYHLDVALRPSGLSWSLTNTEADCTALAARLAEHAPELIVLEATGGCESLAVAILAEAGLRIVIINPRQVRDFAKAAGKLAKTDAIDAAVLALFAERIRPEPRPLPDEASQELNALLTRRRQILEMITGEKNRLHTAREPIRRDISEHIHYLERRLACVNAELDTTIQDSPLWRTRTTSFGACPAWERSTHDR